LGELDPHLSDRRICWLSFERGGEPQLRAKRYVSEVGGEPIAYVRMLPTSQLSGASRLFPIIGDPIRYVESPVWLTNTFADRGRNGVCVPVQVPDGALDVVMAGLAAVPKRLFTEWVPHFRRVTSIGTAGAWRSPCTSWCRGDSDRVLLSSFSIFLKAP